MQCLIVAAGKGLRLRKHGSSKPLVHLADKPLIQHVIENALEGGVTEFVVVTGYRAETLESFLKGYAWDRDLKISFIRNENYELPNGLSVMVAADKMTSPFLLTMCDHWMEPEIYRDMIALAATATPGEVYLATDHNLQNPHVDLEDVTMVKAPGGYIQDIGKGIGAYDCFDTGLFLATGGLFDAIAESDKATGDLSISGGMKILAKREQAKIHNVTGRVWIDVDSPEMFELAEKYLEEKAGVRT